MVYDIAQEVVDISLYAMVSEANVVGSNSREWWIDTSATRHAQTKKCSLPSN